MAKWNATVKEGTYKGQGGDVAVLESEDGKEQIYFSDQKSLIDTLPAGAVRIDLTKLDHGTGEDNPGTMIPSLICAADHLKHCLEQTGKSVGINCVNGNSRTGFALIVFLIRHAGYTEEEASDLICTAQMRRGVKFNLNFQGPNGGYWEWIKINLSAVKDKDSFPRTVSNKFDFKFPWKQPFVTRGLQSGTASMVLIIDPTELASKYLPSIVNTENKSSDEQSGQKITKFRIHFDRLQRYPSLQVIGQTKRGDLADCKKPE